MSKNIYRYVNFYYWLRKISFSNFFQKVFFINDVLKRKVIFYLIYKSLHWRDYNKSNKHESFSGLGSDIKVTKRLVKDLDKFIKDNKINSILDVACGDFMWMKKIVIKNKKLTYHGLEIVKKIVDDNNRKYSSSRIKFECLDVLNNKLPNGFDLIIVRDLFIHIKNQDVLKLIKNIKKSKSKFFAVNNFPNVKVNREIKGYGHHRILNIEIDPFNLKKIYKIINDHDRKLNIYKIL